MKVSAISSSSAIFSREKKISTKNTTPPNDKTLEANFHKISFKGNPAKHPEQIAAYATESNFLDGIYKAGGLGDVAEALPEAAAKHGESIIGKKVDIRTFLPYYSFDDNEGRIYVAKNGTQEKLNKGEKLLRDVDFQLVNQDYKLKEGESFALITNAKDGKEVTKFFFLEETGLNGNVERVGKNSLEMESVPYKVFEVKTNGARQDGIYLIHTPEVASGKSAYGINVKYNNSSSGTTAYGGSTAYGGKKTPDGNLVKHFNKNAAGDIFYTEQIRAMQKALEGMDGVQHKNFNPQNIILHDRFAAVMLTDAMEKAQEGNEYWKGIKYVDLFHNPGRGYQGCYGNPLDFFRIIATDGDIKRLKANPNYEKVKSIAEKIGQGVATQEESEQIYKFFEPYFKNFMDSEGCFNMTKIALTATENNPDLVSPGHVSKYFGKEAADFATEDIAKGLTGDFKRLDNYIISVTNGAKPANMATDSQTGFFGSGTLNDIFKDTGNAQKYTPFSKADGAEKILNAKSSNKKNLINILAEATEKSATDTDALAKVFFSDSKIAGIRGNEKTLKLTLGGISKYTPQDLLFISWGRPDPQKGLKTTARAFRMFLQDETIPLDIRKRCKLLFGAGGGNDAWRPVNGIEPSEWQGIQEEMKKIAEIEVGGVKGVFKNNALYVNGLFPNRLANCADLAILTSRYEPCGITPFESFATGTPVLSIKTGGAPDFVTEGKTGFLTKDAFMLSKETLGLTKEISPEALDNARVENSAKQVKEKLIEYLKPIEEGSFEAKQKTFIENCLNEKIEWHNNNAYNKGKSALEIYLKDKCRTQDNEVNGVFKSNGRGAFGEAPIKTNMEKQNWWNKLSKTNKAILGITGALAILGGGYYLYKNSNKKLLGLPEKNPVAKTEIIKDNSAKIKQKEVKHLSAIV